MMPSAIPARRPAWCAEASCSSSSHCSQPWKATRSACSAAKAATAGESGSCSSVGQSANRGPCSSASTAQVAKSVSPRPSRRPVRREGRLPARGARHREDDLQRLALGLPGQVPVDRGGPGQPDLELDPVPVDLAALLVVEQRVLRDPLQPEVDRVGEAAAGGQVGRGLHRRPRLGRVQRVDQDEVGAVGAGRPDGQVLQVGEVPDPPGLARPDAVQLRGQPPGAALPHPVRQSEPLRGDDQRHRRRPLVRAGVQGVVAQRQVAGDLEGGLAHPAAVDLLRRVPVLQLAQRSAVAAGLQLDPGLRRVAVRDVHLDRRGPVLAQGQQRRQHPGPGPALLLRQRRRGRLRAWPRRRRGPPAPRPRSPAPPRCDDPASPSSRWRCRTPRPGRAGTVRVRAPAHPGRYHPGAFRLTWPERRRCLPPPPCQPLRSP